MTGPQVDPSTPDTKSSKECQPATKSDGCAETPQTGNDAKSETQPSNKTEESKKTKDKDNEDDIILETISPGGIYSLTREVRVRPKKSDLFSAPLPFGGVYTGLKKRASLMPYGYRFFMECFNTAPVLMSVFLLVKLWDSIRVCISKS